MTVIHQVILNEVKNLTIPAHEILLHRVSESDKYLGLDLCRHLCISQFSPRQTLLHVIPVLVNSFDDGFSPGHSERSEESHNLSSRDPSPATAGSG